MVRSVFWLAENAPVADFTQGATTQSIYDLPILDFK